MGNCASSLNCDRCFDPYQSADPDANCITEIEIDADIAGLGVLISFYVSALVLSGVILWGWLKRSLPSDLLTSTDHYAIHLLTRRLPLSKKAQVSIEQTPTQVRTSGMVTGFTKFLGDQQLVTGLAILIAGIASRCDISLFEFNIVTNLAYFATFTHMLSLIVLRDYLYKHTFVRFWRVLFTVFFFVLFCFSYSVNTVIWDADLGDYDRLNQASVFQCIFEASAFDKHVKYSVFDYVTVLGALAWGLSLLLGNLYLPPHTDAVTEIVERTMTGYLRRTQLLDKDRRDIVTNSRFKYYIWFQPRQNANESTKISMWYYLQVYLDAFLSSVPAIFMGLAYGSTSIYYAVWPGDVGDTADLNILGFGQIVALGLLLLTLLSAVEVFNELKVTVPDPVESNHDAELDDSDTEESSDAFPHGRTTRTVPSQSYLMAFLEKFVLLWFSRPETELHTLARVTAPLEDLEDNPIIARRLAKFSCIVWAIHTFCYIAAGIAWNFTVTNYAIAAILATWALFRGFLAVKRILNQVYFVLVEAEQRVKMAELSSLSQQPAASRQSVLSVFDPDSYGPPKRLGTEPDIGLFSRRQTYLSE